MAQNVPAGVDVTQGTHILLPAWTRAVLDGRAKPFGAPRGQNFPPGEQMLQISASAQTVLLSKVAAGRVWDAEAAENAPAGDNVTVDGGLMIAYTVSVRMRCRHSVPRQPGGCGFDICCKDRVCMNNGDAYIRDSSAGVSKEELMVALQEANQEILRLQSLIDEYKWLEEALRRRTMDLSERTKELECMYAVADCLRDLDADIETVLRRIAGFIPRGYQNPRETCVSVTVCGRTFCSPGFKPTSCCQHVKILACGRHIGDVRVYVEPPARPAETAAFLPEESDMLEALAVWIGEAVEHRKAQGDGQRQLRV